jgi:hypothetical protein
MIRARGDARVLVSHRKDWFALANVHLAVLARFDALRARLGRRTATEPSSSVSNEAGTKSLGTKDCFYEMFQRSRGIGSDD